VDFPTHPVVVALPDFVTALLFALTWWRPSLLGRHWVRDLMLTMLLEFIVLHSFAFLVLSVPGQAQPLSWVVGAGAVYLFIAGVFGLAFRSAWPLLVMGWLVAPSCSPCSKVRPCPAGRAPTSCRSGECRSAPTWRASS
jgi:hypothetical protein